jgi:cell division septum initiation protein DivIVA
VKSQVEKLIKILESCSTSVKEWREQSLQFHADNQSKLSEYENIWNLFHMAVSSVDGFTDEIDSTVENLERVQELIPKPEKDQTLKSKINQARTEIDNLDKEIKRLREEKANCDKKIANNENNSSRNVFSCIDPQQRSEELIQRQTSMETSIENKTKQLSKKISAFEKRKTQLYKESKNEEIDRCQKLKERSMGLLQSFRIESEEYEKLSKGYDATNDFKNWEKKIFLQNPNVLLKSQSIEEKTPANEEP